jgi:hypothetical protein
MNSITEIDKWLAEVKKNPARVGPALRIGQILTEQRAYFKNPRIFEQWCGCLPFPVADVDQYEKKYARRDEPQAQATAHHTTTVPATAHHPTTVLATAHHPTTVPAAAAPSYTFTPELSARRKELDREALQAIENRKRLEKEFTPGPELAARCCAASAVIGTKWPFRAALILALGLETKDLTPPQIKLVNAAMVRERFVLSVNKPQAAFEDMREIVKDWSLENKEAMLGMTLEDLAAAGYRDGKGGGFPAEAQVSQNV